MKKPLVSIIIINWDGKHILKNILLYINKIDYKKTETIIVDNGSSDGSVEYLKKFYPRIKIIKNKTNLGFAKANNQGIKQAKGELVLFLNNDTLVTKNFLSILVNKILSNEKIGACQPKILNLEKKSQLDSIGSFMTFNGFLFHYGFRAVDSKKLDKEIKLFSGKGSCLLFKKKILDKIGYFDKDFFAYFEETDLCWRLWVAGYYITYVPQCAVYHKGLETARKLPINFIYFHSFKNRIASLTINLGLLSMLPILLIHIAICFGVAFYFFLVGKSKISSGIIRAIYWNFINIDDTWNKRSYVQSKIRKINDKDIFPVIFKNPPISYYLFLVNNFRKGSRIFSK